MSTDCTFYDARTNAITMVCELSQDTLRHYAEETDLTFLVNVAGNIETQYVVDGALVDFTVEELVAKLSLAPGWAWQMPGRRAADMRTTAQARVIATERINAERDRRIAAFDRFTFSGMLYDGDQAAKENITDAAAGAADDQPLPAGFTWRSFDNTDVPMTNADILAMAKAFRAAANLHKFTMHAIARALKDAAEGDLTNEQLDAITWPE